MNFIEIAKNAKLGALELQDVTSETKNKVLLLIADKIEQNKTAIFEANAVDLKEAKDTVTASIYNRLKLDENKLRDMVQGIRDISNLEDPINKTLLARELDENLRLYRVSVPIGVIGIIFEARPDVITQISSLAIKSSNAVILKGGKESIHTNKILFEIINSAIDEIKEFPKNTINQVYSRDDVGEMLKCDKYIDLIIPRGGNSLVKFIKENTKIPVLGHADGICHIYLDKDMDFEMAKDIIVDSKTQYPSACNAVETLLVHKDFVRKDELLNELENNGITIDKQPETWAFEHGDKTLAVKLVNDVQDAISHINTYGSGHTDCVLTNNKDVAEIFMKKVDSAGVYHNASTRFADGFRYGFGAEVGISTNKTHARGPVGLEGLTIYKYKLIGHGHIVKDYVENKKHFNHKDLI